MGRDSAVRAGLMTEADWQTSADLEALQHFLLEKGSVRKWRLFAVACCRRIDRLITDPRSRRAVEVAARYADGACTKEELEAAERAAKDAEDETGLAAYKAEAAAEFCVTPVYAAACCRHSAAAAARESACRDPRQSDAEPGSYEAKRWAPINESTAAAVSRHVYANFKGLQGDAAWGQARRAAESAGAEELEAQCQLLRDLFGEHLGPLDDKGEWLPYKSNKRIPILYAEQWCQLPTPRVLVLPPECLTLNDAAVVKFARSIYDKEAFDRLPLLADLLAEAGCADAAILAHCREPGLHVKGCWVVDLLIGRE